MIPTVSLHEMEQGPEEFLGHVLRGLGARQKAISPKFLYDTRGSRLFEAICGLDEYYPTRAERTILETCAREKKLRALVGEPCAVVEFGPGPPSKAALVLPELRAEAYIPVDIARTALLETSLQLHRRFPRARIHAVHADFAGLPAEQSPVKLVPDLPAARVGMLLGSTIGNFDPTDAVSLLERIGGWLGQDSRLLVGVDLTKDPDTLRRAYDDSAGVTAQFNLNLLFRINRELGADFDVEEFEHVAVFNESRSRVEMHLRSRSAQFVRVGSADDVFRFRSGETIHTENSYKYTADEFTDLAASAGLERIELWTDPERRFGLFAFKVNSVNMPLSLRLRAS